MGIAELTGKVLWLRNTDLGAAGSLSSWPDASGNGRVSTLVGPAPTIATGQTPLGGKAVAFSSSTANGLDFGLPALAYTASSTYDAAFAPVNAADTDNNTYWHSATTAMPQWWKVGLPAAAVATSYTIQPAGPSSYSGPGTFKFQGSNDDVNWDDLDSQSGITWGAAESKTFPISNTTAYLYYRVYVTVATADGYLRIGTIAIGGVTFVIPSTTPEDRDGEMWMVLASDLPVVGNNGGPFGLGSSGQSTHYGYGGSVYDDTGINARQAYIPTLSIDTWRIYRVRVSGTDWTATIDGAVQATAAGVTRAWSRTIRVGESPTGFAWGGRIAELVVFDRALTSGEATTVNDELVARHFTAPATTGPYVGSSAVSAAYVGSTAATAMHLGTTQVL